jgi:GNAT superfamily N-acetyltransferase
MALDERNAMLERVELDAWRDLYGAVPAPVAAATGLGVHSIGSALLTTCTTVDILAFNRLIGLGLVEPATEAMVDETIARFHAAGVSRFFAPLIPGAEPEELVEWLGARSITLYNNWERLARSTAEPPVAPTDLRIERVGLEDASAFASIVASAFGWPDAATHWIDASFGRSGWHHYIAFDDAEPIATAALFSNGEAGWFGLAATMPSHQGRGAQSALIARRIADAAELGLRMVSVETAEDRPEAPSTSNRNLRRLGFERAYLRPNYIWRDAAP